MINKYSSTREQSGFTLIEIIAAFTILAMSFMVIMEILSHSTRNTIKSSERTRIALLAQTKMDEVGLLIPIEEGSVSGEFENNVDWDVLIEPYEAFYEGDANLDFAPVSLFKVVLTLSWQSGTGKQQAATFTTLKAMTPNFERG
ncbi:MAG: prepilin-type N-terminal cleavage/methylation domain-containing protein [Proteobacteria bacterium]|nr:prepilin-type N-terminal cleavage/methylation domain-containing protein [Pseudomonadota bacterium]